MLEVWGRRNSSNVMSVMWTIAELGLEYKRINVGGSFGRLDSEEYRSMNPNQVIPTINDGGFVLWESNAIVRYLSDKHGRGSLCPADMHTRAIANQWMEWCKTTFYAQMMPAFWQLIRVPKESQDLVAVHNSAKATADVLQILEQHLEKNDYVAGDSLTMGDIPLGPPIHRYFNLEIERPSLPNIEAWYVRLQQRPGYKDHGMVPFGRNLDEWMALEKTEA